MAVPPRWDDLNARSRGLKTHLLGAQRLRALGSVSSLSHLVSRLEQSGVDLLIEGDEPTPEQVELALRRDAGRKLSLLARWGGERTAVLQIIFEAEDLRSLRALLRGAVAGLAPDIRLQGLLPTPALSLRALTELAQLSDVRAIGSLLAAWGNPFAAAVRKQSAGMTDLVRLEVDLAREFLARSLGAARRGDDYLRSHTRMAIDLENVRSALVLSSESHEEMPEQCFVTGGEKLSLERYREAATSGTATAIRVLAVAFRGSAMGTVLSGLSNPAEIDQAIVAALRDHAGSAARLHPLSSAPTLHYALSLQIELTSLRRLVWSIALGAPAGTLVS